jgi:hypothetical protein
MKNDDVLKLYITFATLHEKELSMSRSMSNPVKYYYNYFLNELNCIIQNKKPLTKELLLDILEELQDVNNLYYIEPGINTPFRVKDCRAQKLVKNLINKI